MKISLISAVMGVLALLFISQPRPAAALEAYSPQEQQQFMDWCTGAKSATESTCSCTLKQLAQTVPAAALAQFLSSQGSFNLSSAAVTTGASVTQALLNCTGS